MKEEGLEKLIFIDSFIFERVTSIDVVKLENNDDSYVLFR